MTEGNKQTDDDESLQAILSKRRAAAILMAYRQLGSQNLSRAWHIVNDLSDDSRFQQPDQDMSFAHVEFYLRPRESWKDSAKWLGLTAAFLLVGGIIVGFALPDFLSGIASYSWTRTEATILHVKYAEVRKLRQQRVETWHLRSYQYEYESNGQTYRHKIRRKRF